MRKKLLCLLLTAAMLCLAGCGGTGTPAPEGDGHLRIVATIFPEYDWVRAVLGDNPAGAELKLLLDKGVDMHSFQPTADDMLMIADCDLFLYVGGESDGWVRDALENAVNKDMAVIDLLEALQQIYTLYRMPTPGTEEEGEEGGEGEAEYDEHVWLSLRNAAAIVPEIAAALEALDPANAGVYRANAEAYLDKLDALDRAYAAAVADAPVKTLLFADRFPFRYLTEDYGLNYYAAFAGCSAETEASFETVTFLAKKLDELGLRAVLTIEGSDKRLAETIIRNTRTQDQTILTLNSMQSVTPDVPQTGATYLSVMEDNLAVLKEALK